MTASPPPLPPSAADTGVAELAPGLAAMHRVRRSCRACGADAPRRFLSLGSTPLANSFLSSPADFADERAFPLDVHLCEQCGLVQLLDVIDPEVLFRNYIYVTGTSETLAAHNREYARRVVELLGLGTRDLVVEVASNDGSLLGCFVPHGVRTLGIEPARNIAALARARGIETVDEFFNAATAARVRETHGPAKVVIGNNVLAHVDDTRDFLAGAASLLEPDGLVITEVPYLAELVAHLEYDTIYHEHLCYFSVSALMTLCEAVGLVIVRMDRVPVHGGSLRMYAGLRETHGAHGAAVEALAREEREAGLLSFERYERFAADVATNQQRLVALLERLHAEGKSIAGYGAPAKGNTLLNACGIDTRLVPYTVDRSPHKIGLYTPGMHIPVLPVSALLERQPDYVLLLAWNFADEIMRQQAEYRQRGGKFIVPIPDPIIT